MTLYELIYETFFPILEALGVILRGLGALAFGLVFGAIIRSVTYREETTKYLLPVVFGMSVVLFFMADSNWAGSPATLGMLGVGVFVGFLFLRSQGAHAEES